jgi:hypothetical protein
MRISIGPKPLEGEINEAGFLYQITTVMAALCGDLVSTHEC